ncbi:MAG: hypothetical protein FE834_00380 [Gammaproteobacteria bacterium]|nr:hypothetical protein [Gammaproteobacteria bacterium]
MDYTPVFTDLNNITASSNTLTANTVSSTGGRWTNSGSYSSTNIATNGFVSAQAGETNKNLAFGLSSSNDVNSSDIYKEIDYSIRFYEGEAHVFEAGTGRNVITLIQK